MGSTFDIQGGGSDLKFPHHEFSAAHAEAALGVDRMAQFYVHTGMIGLDGVKMSKSLGNLVFVHKLVEQGEDPSAIRLGVFSGHYRAERDWSDEVLGQAKARLATWRTALEAPGALSAAEDAVAGLRQALADDLDTPAALRAIDNWAGSDRGEDEEGAAQLVRTALDSLLGVRA